MTAADWNIASVWETIAAMQPEAVAQVRGATVTTWSQFDLRAGRLAARLTSDGVSRQGKVALYLRNGPEYMESTFAAFKATAVPVNTNYRYGGDEIRHVWTNADAESVIFHGEFTALVESLKDSLPSIVSWIWVNDGIGACPDWAGDYEMICTTGTALPPGEASGDDQVLIYTGGTTGMPKGVMWRQHDLYMASNTTGDPDRSDLAHVAARIENAKKVPVGLSAAPLMHGTGFVFAMTVLSRGGRLVTQQERRFDAATLLDLIESQRVTDLCIVGDAFARPIADCLDAEPTRWDISCLKAVSSSGMVWSSDVKQRLLAYAPEALLIDFLNSSEASGMGRTISSNRKRSGERSERANRFQLGKNAFVIDDAGRPLAPGDCSIGRLAVRGYIPLGYYKDPVKSAETFPVIEGIRCSIPGDHARLLADGTIELLGRGSTTINTGGEKVFAEEVEAAIKTCPGVRDALVVGLPDERFGQILAAAVEGTEADLDAETVIEHVRRRLARYKAPRHVMIVPDVGRTVTGKADYPAVRQRIANWLKSA